MYRGFIGSRELAQTVQAAQQTHIHIRILQAMISEMSGILLILGYC